MKQKKCLLKRILPAVLTGLLVLTAAAGLSAAPVQGADTDPGFEPEPVINTDDYDYRMSSDKTIIITKYSGSDDVIEIPSQIDGLPVSEIGYQAFRYVRMKSLTIPEGIRTIGSYAFEYCEVSDSITLPADILLEEGAFSYAQLPPVVTIPAGAQLEKNSFSYCKGLEALLLEGGAVVKKNAFDYSKNLRYAICAAGVKLENSAFDYCKVLEQVILCGGVETEEEPVTNSSSAQLVFAGEEDFALFLDDLSQVQVASDGTATYALDEMTFTASSELVRSRQPGYDLFLIEKDLAYMLGASVFPASMLDFEKDETIRTMVESAEAYVSVDAAYKVRVCGYPAVWIDIRDETDGSAGVYLYISLENKMYFLMFVNMQGNRDAFPGIVDSVTIGGQSDGTDLSAAGV